jgi:thiol-disulfide isomerase/thioredoxin
VGIHEAVVLGQSLIAVLAAIYFTVERFLPARSQHQFYPTDWDWLVVDVWATWRIPCLDRFPHIVELNRRYQNQSVAVISMSVNDREDKRAVEMARRFLVNQNASSQSPHWTKTFWTHLKNWACRDSGGVDLRPRWAAEATLLAHSRPCGGLSARRGQAPCFWAETACRTPRGWVAVIYGETARNQSGQLSERKDWYRYEVLSFPATPLRPGCLRAGGSKCQFFTQQVPESRWTG